MKKLNSKGGSMNRKIIFVSLFMMIIMSLAAMAFAFPTAVDFSGVVGDNDITIPNSYTLNGITFSYDNLGDPASTATINNLGISGSTVGSLLFSFDAPAGELGFNFAQVGATSPIIDALYIDFQSGGGSIGDALFNTAADGTGVMTFVNGVAFDQAQMFFSTDTATFTVDNISYGPVPPTGTLTGTVDLLDYYGDITTVPVSVELNGVIYNLNLAPDGKFTILDVVDATYDVRIKASHWLSKLTSGVIVNGNTDVGIVSLINGDINGDNGIDESDLAIMSNDWYQATADAINANSDINGDGGVDESDLAIMSKSWYFGGN